MVNQQIYLPMIPDSAPIVVNISQNDFDAAGYAGRLFFNLVTNGVAYDMDGATAIFQGEKPDGTSFAYPATVVNDSVVRVNVRQQMTVVSGRVVCQLVLNNTDGQIGSFNIWLEVQPSGAAGGDPSQTDIPALIAQAHEYADQAEQSAINAAAWSANPPYIGANGNWFVYDADTEAYVDTGVYASGTEGSLWYTGTAVNGKDVNPHVFPTGIATAREHDMYLNKTEGAIYQCTLGGPDSTAKWAYVMTLSGGGGGASDYPDLGMKPEINGHTLQGGNQTGASLGLQNTLTTGDGIDITGNEISAKLSAGTNVSLATQPDGTIEISAAGGGGGMLPYLYIDSEAGATVTVNQPDSTVITPTAAGSGHWECELTGGYGTYVIHSVLAGQGDATQSLVVDTVMEYHVTDTHYDHTVSFVAPSGSTVRIEGGTEIYTLTGTGSTQTQAVHSASTSFTVTATMDGNGKPYTFTTPSTTGQTTTIPSGTFDFGTINVSVAADFVTAGSTITCVNGGTSCTPKTAASTLVFRVPTTGTWTISGEVSGQTYPTTATVTALGTPVSTSLQTTPEGSTVLPTDDIQTWLHCASIYDKTYTTLSQVLADSTTLLALMSDNNAVDYLVRSTTWATDICADSTAMTDIGANNYCADTLLDDEDWLEAIANSTYIDSVLNVKVPAMTSNTTPSGVASALEEYPGSSLTYRAYFAFDGVTSAPWLIGAANRNSGWIQYQFTSPEVVKAVKLTNSTMWGDTANVKQFKIQGYNTSSAIQDLGTFESKDTTGGISSLYYLPNNSDSYQVYRLQIILNNGSANGTHIEELQFYGREDV
jgi:hypothetical protein